MSDPMAEDLECREVVEVVTDYLEGAMPPGERLRFDHHLALCEGCQAYLEQMRTVIRVAGRPAVDAVPPETMAGLLRAFRDWRR
ncbi:MAG TPA: zf-HC2 domain-containing protein [Actinomycetota bacterium]|jgi:anti-sigma factor RsiW|nr:zf-HC2 domain-containing protein [Actinomycetota bacterium]